MNIPLLFRNFGAIVHLYSLIYTITCQTNHFEHENLLSRTRLSDLSNFVDRKISNLYERHTHMSILPERDDGVRSENVNVERILSSLINKITDLVEVQELALKDIVDGLETATRDYVWQDDFETNDTDYFILNTTNGFGIDELSADLDDVLGISVNKSMSCVHVPVEIYEGYPDVANGIRWSSAVDNAFIKNSDRYPNLSWQFFASQKGFTRIYPAVTKFNAPPPYHPVDLFDSRRRPWYVQAAASPKDVVILLDRSGSVHGQTFTIMKFAIEVLIDTFSEDDFVNIAAFNETTSWISEIVSEEEEDFGSDQCYSFNETLIQATNVNKKALKEDAKLVSAQGIANYTDALLFAYEVFRKRSENGETGANCNKLIMLFSDGGTQWPGEIIEKYQNESATSNVRIFTYAVGPHPTPTAVLKNMACKTGGRHTVIFTSSGVRSKIQESYLDIISEGFAESDKHPFLLTSAYTSALTNNLTLTLTNPVFNISSSLIEEGRSELLGVAGIDIPLHSLDNMVPKEVLGPLGYVFILNHNGFTAMHPKIHPQVSYLEDALHIDFLDLELNPSKLVQARDQMVNGLDGTVSFPGLIELDEDHFINSPEYQTYKYSSLLDSKLSMGVFSMLSSRHMIVTKRFPFTSIDPKTSILAPWNFCGTQQSMSHPHKTNDLIDKGECDQKLINDVMWAQGWTESLIQRWNQMANSFDVSDNIINRAIYTRFGLARVVPGSFNESNDVEEASFGLEWRNPMKNPALKYAILQEGIQLFPHHEGVFLSKPAFVNNVVAATVGVNVTSLLMDELLLNGMEEAGISPNHSIVMVVDAGAFIISSSFYPKSSGEFLGVRWPLLLEKIVEAGIFGKVHRTDFQAQCKDADSIRSKLNSATSLPSPTQFLIKVFVHAAATLEYLQCFIHTLFTSSIWTSTPATAIYKSGEETDTCILEKAVYFLTDKKEFSGNISCYGDSAQVLVVRINGTNAILVAVDQSLVNLNCDGWMKTPNRLINQSPIDSSRMRMAHPKEFACRKPFARSPRTDCELSKSEEKCVNSASLIASCEFSFVLGLLLVLVIGLNVKY